MNRYGMIVGVKADRLEEYQRLHRAVWPEVLKTIKDCNLNNYSIFLREMPDGHHYLFSYFEYAGSDFKADMARMAAMPKTQEWWSLCWPCLIPLNDGAEGECWTDMECVFHLD